MLNKVMMSTLFGFTGIALAFGDVERNGSAPRKITSSYLLAHGFKQVEPKAPIYKLEHVRLADVARDLGFSRKSLKPIVNQSDVEDLRTVEIGDRTFGVRSEVRNKAGDIVAGSLDDPDATCTISVSLFPHRTFLKTDSSPTLRVISVAVPDDRSEPLEIELELGANGKKPVAIQQSDFHVSLDGDNIRASRPGCSFPEETPRIVVVSPDKPATFKLSASVMETLGPLSPGEYALRLSVAPPGKARREPQRYDYEWEGLSHRSNEFKFVVE